MRSKPYIEDGCPPTEEPTSTFQLTQMVRLDYSFPDVDDKTRSKIYDILHDRKYVRFRGGGGDGSNNSGVSYLTLADALELRERLSEAGLIETISEDTPQ